MKLKPGFEVEYQKRHDEIWPELSQVLTDVGVTDYSIFLDDATQASQVVARLVAHLRYSSPEAQRIEPPFGAAIALQHMQSILTASEQAG
jgi:L-rhamnose mutarotase